MYFEQFYLGCLAHASYLIASDGDAVVVDPQRDVDIYIKAAADHGMQVRHIFETHLHADFISGHQELAERCGAKIYIGASAQAAFPHVPVGDGFDLKFGRSRIKVLETPGHTLESICLVLTDDERTTRPYAVLTGDTLFIGDVGRPDLSRKHTPQQLAGMLYDSLHQKLMPLADDVLVYPAHGAGSLCGRNMRAERSSTIGTERLTNYALQIRSKEEFVRHLTSNLPTRPEYFVQDAEINRQGAPALSDLDKLLPIEPAELQTMIDDGVIALDVRPVEHFAAGHVPGSINIALSGQFASWAGALLGLSSRPVLIADTDEQLAEARMRLARIGLESEHGYLRGGVAAWQQAGLPLEQLEQISAPALAEGLRLSKLQLLDIRREPEWMAGHIAEANWHALENFRVSTPEIDSAKPLAIHCQSGYRSTIACSLLQRAGFKNVVNLTGGMEAWKAAGLPVYKSSAVAV